MKKFIIILIFLFAVSFVSAADISIQEEAIKDVLLPGEEALFEVRIINHQDVDDTFRFSSIDINWDLITDDSLYFQGGDSRTIDLRLDPYGVRESGNYGIPVVLSSIKNPDIKTEKLFKISIIDLSELAKINLLRYLETNLC
jgi:uncharacterized membrane protein